METPEEMAAIFKRFGDEQSTLLDQYERLSFEVQLNQAMLGRSLSEPAGGRCQAPPKQVTSKPVKRRRGSGFQKVIKKLFSPILVVGKKGSSARKDGTAPDPKDPMFWKTFSRSLRV
ncbi:UNVERIFIED_CONTAM: hypothetical protein Slati_1647000 [Sesamum latifolium]|uniref:Uncharacterized protein n=1 Tax=Sesamum latifolium TaxID=2727402 RepID=A0AAW2XBB8_9LAMI